MFVFVFVLVFFFFSFFFGGGGGVVMGIFMGIKSETYGNYKIQHHSRHKCCNIIARNVLIDNKCHTFRNTEWHTCHNHKQARRRNRGLGLN